MTSHTLIDIACAGVLDFGALLICNSLLFFALQKLKTCGYINRWVLLVFEAAYSPIIWVLWFIGIFSIYYQLSYHESFELVIKNVEQIQILSFLFLFCWFLLRLKSLIESEILQDCQKGYCYVNPILIPILSKIITILILFCSVGAFLHVIGIPFQTLLIVRGGISIALGLGAQHVLSNFFGGLIVLINRPFRVGDWVSSPDRNIEGVVEGIGWHSTTIRTLDRRPLYVPNSIFTHIVIMNSSLMYNRQIKQIVAISYQDVNKIIKITHEIESMLRSHQEIDQGQLIMANWVEFGTYALHIEVHAFTKTTDRFLFRKVQQEIYIKIVHIIENHGAKLAIPVHVVNLELDKNK